MESFENFITRLLTVDVNGLKNEVTGFSHIDSEDMTIYNIRTTFNNENDGTSNAPLEGQLVVNAIKNGGFINDDGKFRTVINSAKMKSTIRVYGSTSISASGIYINFKDQSVKIDEVNGVNEAVIEILTFYNYFGLVDRYFNNINKSLISPVTPDEEATIKAFTLKPRVVTKLKLFYNTKDISNKLTADTVSKLTDLMNHSDEINNMIIPSDFGYYDLYESLVDELRSNYRELRKKILYNLNKHDNLYLTPIQSAINKFFRMQFTEINSVQTGTDTNPISLATQAQRLNFYYKNPNGGYSKDTTYSNYFVGVLDPIKTSDSSQVNIHNELTLNTKVVDSVLYITLLDKEFNEVTVTYDKYAESKVLVEDQIDYKHKKLLPKNGKYVVYYLGKYTEVTNPDEIDYLRPINNLVSASTAMVPFLNKTDSTRGMLGAHMVEQAVPVVNSKPDIVYTPFSKSIYNKSVMNIRSTVDGTVTGILDDLYIKIKDSKGGETVVKSPDYKISVLSTTTKYSPAVKVGDTVKKGQVIFEANSFKNHQFSIGVPLYVAMTTYNGTDHEDGYVLTESAAKKFSHPMVREIVVDLKDGISYDFSDELLNDVGRDRFTRFGIIKSNLGVNAGNVLMRYIRYADPESAYAKTQVALGLVTNNEPTITSEVTVPNDIRNGIVKKVTVLYNSNSRNLNKDLINYYDNIKNTKAKEVYEFTGNKEDMYDNYIPEPGILYRIIFRIEYYLDAGLGDKFCNRYGTKGVCSAIIPDELAPRDAMGRHFEVLFSPLSTYSRMNLSQIYEAKLGLVGVRGFELLDRYIKTGEDFDKVKQLLELVYEDFEATKESVTEVYNQFKQFGYLRFEVNQFDTFYTAERIVKALNILGFSGNGDEKVYFPEYNRWTTNTVTIGFITVMRLHFIPSNRATASSITHIVDKMPFGLGNVRTEGQKIGNQEVWAYVAHGKVKELQETIKENETKSNSSLPVLLAIGLDFK